jgi:4-amino-4-deoxy-L-arabinose transferase-like glycosyltransferase
VASRAGRRAQPSRSVLAPEAVCFFVILLIASFLRLWQIGRNGFSGDEAVYAGQSAVLAGVRGYGHYFILVSRGNSNFLLFQEIVSIFFRAFGVDDVIPRVIGALFGIALVIVIYAIGRLAMGRRAGLAAMALAALSSYAVALSRLALLDTCAAFFTALAILMFLLWEKAAALPGSMNRAVCFFAAFAAAAVLACEAKVSSVTLVVIVRGYRGLTLRALVIAALVGFVALTPALIQVADHAGVITAALSSSIHRSSRVSWSYYPDILLRYEGALALVGALLALLYILWQRRREDLLLWLWLAVGVLYVELNPLKAYNYLLVVVVPLTLLCGAGIGRLSLIPRFRATSDRSSHGVLLAGAALVTGVGLAVAAIHLDTQVDAVQNPGVKEVAAWLDAHTGRGAGVMTLSQGSGQYAVAFYANRNAYPFGRFRLATVLPGGEVLVPKPTAPGKFPLDWIRKFPNEYVRDGRITYFVYNLEQQQDDPSESTFAGLRLTQRNYLALIESYGGKLVDSISDGHHGRVLIFRATRRSASSTLTYRIDGRYVELTGTGYDGSEQVAVYYHGKEIAKGRTDPQGRVEVAVGYPARTSRAWHFVMTDLHGHGASASGLAAPAVTIKATASGLEIAGSGFAPGTQVSISYMKATIGRTEVSPSGRVSTIIPLPPLVDSRYRLRVSDSIGRTASVINLKQVMRATGNEVPQTMGRADRS